MPRLGRLLEAVAADTVQTPTTLAAKLVAWSNDIETATEAGRRELLQKFGELSADCERRLAALEQEDQATLEGDSEKKEAYAESVQCPGPPHASTLASTPASAGSAKPADGESASMSGWFSTILEAADIMAEKRQAFVKQTTFIAPICAATSSSTISTESSAAEAEIPLSPRRGAQELPAAQSPLLCSPCGTSSPSRALAASTATATKKAVEPGNFQPRSSKNGDTPVCATPGCIFYIHSKVGLSEGKYCCKACAKGEMRDGKRHHGPQCQRIEAPVSKRTPALAHAPMPVKAPPPPPPPLLKGSVATHASVLAKVFWMNLTRRPDRAKAHQAELRAARLTEIGERISAVDGRQLDLNQISETILSADGRAQAASPPAKVLGCRLTPGAVGLYLTWHDVLTRIAKLPDNGNCFLIVEDDAQYVDGFRRKMDVLLKALDTFDRLWEVCAVGYINSKSHTRGLLGPAPKEGTSLSADHVIGLPSKLCGASAILLHGARAAKTLLTVLFPVAPNAQFDLQLSNFGGQLGGRLALYMSRMPLAVAPLSEEGDTDIQRLPEDKKESMEFAAKLRYVLCDGPQALMPDLAKTRSDQAALSNVLQNMDQETKEVMRSLLHPQALTDLGSSNTEDKVTGKICADLAAAVSAGAKRAPEREVNWSISGPFYVVGSWTDWEEFHELSPWSHGRVRQSMAGASVHRAKIEVREGEAEEFQIVAQRNWKLKFFPCSSFHEDYVLGPLDRGNAGKFQVKVPRGCRHIWVQFDPTGTRRVTVELG